MSKMLSTAEYDAMVDEIVDLRVKLARAELSRNFSLDLLAEAVNEKAKLRERIDQLEQHAKRLQQELDIASSIITDPNRSTA